MSASSTDATAASDFDGHQPFKTQYSTSSRVSEIEEEITDEANDDDDDDDKTYDGNRGTRLPSIKENYFEGSSDVASLGGDDIVYIGVGKGESSMDALSWTLRHAINPSSTLVFLVHVFPETHYIPYPLGKLPKNQASPEQVESYMAQESGKRRELLHKFVNACSSSNLKQVKVENILIESDMVAKAIQDLIPILNMKKLVLGISKSNARKLRSRRGNGIAEQILKSSATATCEVKIICEGKEVKFEEMMESPSPRPNVGGDDSSKSPKVQHQPSDLPRKKDQSLDPFACCFNKPKTNK